MNRPICRLIALVLFFGALFVPHSANAKLKACKTSITACGCTAKKTQRYVVASSLTTASNTVDCITVAKAGVVVDLNGNSLTGPGAGATNAGIHVLAAATGSHIEGNGFKNSISGFGVGIMVDGDSVTVASIDVLRNIDYGIELNAGSSNAIYDLNAGDSSDSTSGNGIAGVFINDASGTFVDDIHADYNGQYGLEVSGSSENSLHDLDGDHNGVYGIWIKGANSTKVVNSTATDNGQDGIYIGCAPTGGIGGACDSNVTSSFVVVKFGQFLLNGSTGIAVDSKDLANQIGLNVSNGNTAADAADANTNCGTNLWFFDSFGSPPSPSCIH